MSQLSSGAEDTAVPAARVAALDRKGSEDAVQLGHMEYRQSVAPLKYVDGIGDVAADGDVTGLIEIAINECVIGTAHAADLPAVAAGGPSTC